MEQQLQATLRLVFLMLAAVTIQTAVLTQISPWGVVPDVIPVLVACVGLLAGSTVGATFGFAAGFMIDLMLLQTMGVSSLLLTGAGYMAGRLRELRDPVHPFTAPAVGAVVTFAFEVAFAAMQFLLGQPGPDVLPFIWQTLVATAFGALLAVPAFRAARWAVLPMLYGFDDPVHRRRRASMATVQLGSPRRASRRSRRMRRRLRS